MNAELENETENLLSAYEDLETRLNQNLPKAKGKEKRGIEKALRRLGRQKRELKRMV